MRTSAGSPSRPHGRVVRSALLLAIVLIPGFLPGMPAALSGPGAAWAADSAFGTLRALLHPAVIAAGMLYLGLRVIRPLRVSPPAKAALLIAAALFLGRVYVTRQIYLIWQYELPRTLHVGWCILQLALCIFLLLLAASDILAPLLRRLRRTASGTEVPDRRAGPGLRAGLFAAALSLAAFGCFSALRVPPVTPKEIVVPGLPAAWDGLTVAHLSDLHVSKTFPASWLAEVVRKVNAAKPDLVVITGDIFDGDPKQSIDELRPLRDLRAPLGVHACLGNHEYYADLRRWGPLLAELGPRILQNEHIVLRRNGAELILAGVTDSAAAAYRLPPPDIGKALRGASPELPLLLLAHRPALADQVRRLSRPGATLQLSGHTHAGQIIGLAEIIKYLNKGYLNGLYALGDMRLHVSPGTALSSSYPFRLGVPSSDIPLLTLRAP